MRLKLRIKKAVSLEIELNTIHQDRNWANENWYLYALSRKNSTREENPPDNGYLPDHGDIMYYQVPFTTEKDDLVLHRFSSFDRERLERFIEQQPLISGSRSRLDEWFERHPGYLRLMNDGMDVDIQGNQQLADKFGTMFYFFDDQMLRGG